MENLEKNLTPDLQKLQEAVNLTVDKVAFGSDIFRSEWDTEDKNRVRLYNKFVEIEDDTYDLQLESEKPETNTYSLSFLLTDLDKDDYRNVGVTNKGLHRYAKIVDEIKNFITEVLKYENEMKVITIEATQNKFSPEVIDSMLEFLVDKIKKNKNALEGFIYEDSYYKVTVKNGFVTVIDNQQSREYELSKIIEKNFDTKDESDIFLDQSVLEQAVKFIKKEPLDTIEAIEKKLRQRFKLYARTVEEKFSDYRFEIDYEDEIIRIFLK